MKIKSQRDFWSGLMFVATGIVFTVGATNYSLGTSARPGPGYFPLILSVIMALLGARPRQNPKHSDLPTASDRFSPMYSRAWSIRKLQNGSEYQGVRRKQRTTAFLENWRADS